MSPIKLVIFALGVFVVTTVVVKLLYGLQKKLRPGSKNGFPEKLSVSVGDGFCMTLERKWYRGRWVYIFFGKPPYSHRSPDEDESIKR